MQDEAEITVNGTRLTDNEAAVIRLALATFADILTNQLGVKDAAFSLTERYQNDVTRVRALIAGAKARRTQ